MIALGEELTVTGNSEEPELAGVVVVEVPEPVPLGAGPGGKYPMFEFPLSVPWTEGKDAPLLFASGIMIIS